MKCDISRDQLWAWVHEETDPAESRALETHVSSCDTCQESLAEMRALIDDLRALPDETSAFASGGGQAEPSMPDRIGDFRIVRKLGAGGMGVVFEATQSAPDRTVALKLIRTPGLADDYQRRLFHRELQTLAKLNHPGIAAIYAAGTAEQGVPYFAMEFVPGKPLGDYVRDATPPLDLRARLRLFLQVCEAVEHAHQRGIIHRDLKPSNIMVSESGRAKVLDFGLARAVDPEHAGASMISETNRVVGTLHYMSPEQARGDDHAIDTRADVYALGVILFELLTGVLPYSLAHRPLPEAVRIICEQSPPDVRVRNRAVPRDVATITTVALAKEPERRYASVSDLAADVRRFLTHHPIEARPASLAYRVRKLAQRHKVASGLVALIAFLLTGAAITFAVQADQIAAQRDVARREAEKATAINDFLVNMLASIDPGKALGRPVTVREVVDEAAARAADELAAQPEIEAAIRHTIGRVFYALAIYEQAEEQLTRAVTLRRTLHPGGHPELADSLGYLGSVLYDRGDYDRAVARLQAALEIRERLDGPRSASVAESLHDLGVVHWQTGNLADAAELLTEAAEIRRARLGENATERAKSLSALGLVKLQQGTVPAARGLFEEALRIEQAAHPAAHPDVAVVLNNLALASEQDGAIDEATRLINEAMTINRAVYGEPHPTIAANLVNLGRLAINAGDLERGEQLMLRSLEMDREIYGPTHPNIAIGLNGLAVVAYQRADYDTAISRFERALEIKRETLGERHDEIATDLNNIGVVHRAVGNLSEAERYFRRALAMKAELFPAEHPDVAQAHAQLAELLLLAEKFAAALPVAREAARIRTITFGENDPDTELAWVLVGRAQAGLGELTNARDTLATAYEALVDSLGADHAVVRETAGHAANVCDRLGETDAGRRWRERSDLRNKNEDE